MNLLENAVASVKQVQKVVYNINIDDYKFKGEIILALIHEIIHIQQIQNKELFIYKTYCIYKGKLYNSKNSTYETRPFEKEAIEQSENLYKKYKSEFKNL